MLDPQLRRASARIPARSGPVELEGFSESAGHAQMELPEAYDLADRVTGGAVSLPTITDYVASVPLTFLVVGGQGRQPAWISLVLGHTVPPGCSPEPRWRRGGIRAGCSGCVCARPAHRRCEQRPSRWASPPCPSRHRPPCSGAPARSAATVDERLGELLRASTIESHRRAVGGAERP